MRARWLAIPVTLTILLVFIIFVPLVQTPGGTSIGCGPTGCVTVVQYTSISYAYGGWGAFYQTGVNGYSVDEWVCFCPAEVSGQYVQCCVAPLAWIIWPVVGLLSLVDLVSLVIITRKLAKDRQPEPSAIG